MTEKKVLKTVSKRGQKLSPEFIKNMREYSEGRKHTPEEIAKIKASNKRTIHRRQTFQDVARMMLEMAPEPKIVEKLRQFLPGLEDKEITNRVAMMQKMIEKALNGDNYAFQIIRDTSGEKPVEKQEVIGAVTNTYTQVDKSELKQALIDAKKVLNELE